MSMQIVKAIQALVPGAEFKFENEDLDTLVWLCDLPQPTKKEIQQQMADASK
jgi:hypothetical protein